MTRNRRVFLVVVSFILILGLSLVGCRAGREARREKIKKAITTSREETTATPTEEEAEETPQAKVITDVDAVDDEVSKILSEVDSDIKEIENIDVDSDNESGY